MDYFDSYEDLGVHKLMLNDQPRTLAYKQAIANAVRGKTVLDVGCGTGILSLFCAQSGARKVYAVEASKMAFFARDIMANNEFASVVNVIHDRMENVTLPEQVDVIMGFYLLHESMLESVIVARDRWLKQGGLMLPDRAVIYASPVNVDRFIAKHALYWNDVYGFDMSVLAAAAYGSFHSKPQIAQLRGDEILASPRVVAEFELHSITQQQLASVAAQLQFTIDHDVTVHAFALWFDVAFPDGSILATGPASAKTHWKQTLVFLPQPVTLPGGFELECDVAMQQDAQNRRHYAVQLALPDVQGDVLDSEQMEIEAVLCHSECECAKVSACCAVLTEAVLCDPSVLEQN